MFTWASAPRKGRPRSPSTRQTSVHIRCALTVRDLSGVDGYSTAGQRVPWHGTAQHSTSPPSPIPTPENAHQIPAHRGAHVCRAAHRGFRWAHSCSFALLPNHGSWGGLEAKAIEGNDHDERKVKNLFHRHFGDVCAARSPWHNALRPHTREGLSETQAGGMGVWGLQRSDVDPPLCSSRPLLSDGLHCILSPSQ